MGSHNTDQDKGVDHAAEMEICNKRSGGVKQRLRAEREGGWEGSTWRLGRGGRQARERLRFDAAFFR